MPQLRTRKLWRIVRSGTVGVLLLIVLGCGISALSNFGLARQSVDPEHLSDREYALVAEAQHLRRTLGDTVWPGWGSADIPVIRYNEAYAFLIGVSDPADGWYKVPDGPQRGTNWEPLPHQSGATLYRQALPAASQSPEAFAVLVGDRWVGSMATYEWMQIALREQIRSDLPQPLAAVVPYRLISRIFVGSSEWYMAATLHESFHAYQGMQAPERLAAAERAAHTWGDRYPWDASEIAAGWQAELGALTAALRAETDAEAATHARRFLQIRAERRSASALQPELIDYERQREWLEGSAKYIELAIWRAASGDYTPSAAISGDPNFHDYQGYEQRLNQEVAQIERSTAGDSRFYYSGMAQALLLDRFAPGWQRDMFAADARLEALLAGALAE